MFKQTASASLHILGCRRGAAMVEYALLAALIALVATASLKTVGTNISTKFAAVAAAI